MTRAAWEFLRSDRPELNMLEWDRFPLRIQLQLANIDPEEIIAKLTALRLNELNMTWEVFFKTLDWSKDWTFYPEIHDTE